MNKTAIVQQAKTSSILPPAQGRLQRKCACGNHTVAGGECAECAKKKDVLQRKLTIGASSDPLEQEADRVADQVMGAPAHSQGNVAPLRIQRFTGQTSKSSDTVPDSVDRVLASPGRPLDPSLQLEMGQRFGHDFSRVRVHTGAMAEQSARDVNALAYTVGRDVVFGAGRLVPDTREGKRLIAHELTHVLQQSGDGFGGGLVDEKWTPSPISPKDIPAAHSPTEAAGMVTRQVAKEHTDSGQQLRRQPAPGISSPPAASSLTAGLDPSANSSCRIEFRQGTTDAVDPASRDACLETVRAYVEAGSGQVELHGYASEEGDAQFNADLARRRAEAVKRLLVARRVPVTAISPIGHGVDRTYPGLAPNRRVEVVLSRSLTFADEEIIIPRFICGPDVTRQVEDAVASARSLFAGWTPDQKNEACEALRGVSTGGYAWDIIELHNRDWILDYRPLCATQGATPPCGTTVQVGSDCYFSGSPNYVIFGTMCRLCYDHFYAQGRAGANVGYTGWMDFTEQSMLDLINLYKSSSGNVGPSRDWAVAGRDGWPSGGSPPTGDRPGCAPQCSLPYTGLMFRVNWYPHSFHTGR